jgi:hypothetical protein
VLFPNTTDKLQLTTSSTANIDVYSEWVDMDNTTKVVTPGRGVLKITTATTTDIVPAPASGSTRKVKRIAINNIHASASNGVSILYNANGTTYMIDSWTLLFGERVGYQEGRGFKVYDASGFEKTATSARTTGSAITAQIASHSADTYYLGMNVASRVQAGSWFRWTFRTNKGGGTATPIYTIRYGTAGTVSDTARVTITGAAQTAVADEGYIMVEATFRAVGGSAVLVGQVHLWHRLATTGLSVTASNVFATPVVSGTFDSTVANSIIGLSVNPGTSGAWVTDLVTLDTGNLLPSSS